MNFRILGAAVGAALLAAAPISHAQAPAPAGDPRPALLRALDGNWRMAGDVKGKAVNYAMSAAPALQGNFTEMRMGSWKHFARYEVNRN